MKSPTDFVARLIVELVMAILASPNQRAAAMEAKKAVARASLKVPYD